MPGAVYGQREVRRVLLAWKADVALCDSARPPGGVVCGGVRVAAEHVRGDAGLHEDVCAGVRSYHVVGLCREASHEVRGAGLRRTRDDERAQHARRRRCRRDWREVAQERHGELRIAMHEHVAGVAALGLVAVAVRAEQAHGAQPHLARAAGAERRVLEHPRVLRGRAQRLERRLPRIRVLLAAEPAAARDDVLEVAGDALRLERYLKLRARRGRDDHHGYARGAELVQKGAAAGKHPHVVRVAAAHARKELRCKLLARRVRNVALVQVGAHLVQRERLALEEHRLGVRNAVALEQVDGLAVPHGHGVHERSVAVEDGGRKGHVSS